MLMHMRSPRSRDEDELVFRVLAVLAEYYTNTHDEEVLKAVATAFDNSLGAFPVYICDIFYANVKSDPVFQEYLKQRKREVFYLGCDCFAEFRERTDIR